MRKAETLLGSLAAALALVALGLSLTQQIVEYVSSHIGPNGGPEYIYASPITLNVTSAPVTLVGIGALLVCLGAVIDARIRRRSRVTPLAMLVIGAIFCTVAVLLVSTADIWIYAWRLYSDPLQPLYLVTQVARVPHVSLSVLYAPIAMISDACALAALSRHQSRPHA